MKIRATSLVPLLLLVGALTPLALADDVATPDAERFKVKLLSVETSYGQEKWKTSPAFQTADRRTLENDVGQYDGAIGYRVILRVQLVDEWATTSPATSPTATST